MTSLEANLYRGTPDRTGNGTGALVLAGSSGRIDTARVDMLSARGVTAAGLRWFGGDGLPELPSEVPLEHVLDAVDLMGHDCDRVVLLGLSYGAEAALLTASIDPRPAAVVALAPTDVAWEGHRHDEADPARSKWTHAGRPVPYVPLDRSLLDRPLSVRSREPAREKPAFVDLYLRSLDAAGAGVVAAAEIPVERFGGEMLLVVGGDDRVWPSARAAARIEARRAAAGLPTTVVRDERAGHPVVLPGEAVPDLDRPYLVGGDAGAPQRLGRRAWPHIARLLDLEPQP
ncbi:alpha/beta fold hydrolase [Brachybacterium sp. AOP43-C2-M15]|uniref:alpha/beta fold hydrolase n=1 Tax=Brachybacterium sp. AOP43-C2-M15 TaxID=3457661 RepID=UPI004033B945